MVDRKQKEIAHAPGIIEQIGIKPDLTRPIVAGIMVILVFVGILGGWMALAPLKSAAIAPGVVSVDTNRKTIQHLEGGIIEKILVREGDKVSVGQVLVKLDKTQSQTKLRIMDSQRLAALALKERLVAERDKKPAIQFRNPLLKNSTNTKIQEILHGEKKIFEGRRQNLKEERAILEKQILSLKEGIKGFKGRIKSEKKRSALVGQEISVMKTLAAKGLTTRSRLVDLQRANARIRGEISQDLANLSSSRQKIQKLRLEMENRSTTTLNQINLDLKEVQKTLMDLPGKIRIARDILSRKEVRAPLDGTIVDLKVHTVGGVIAPGEPLMDLVPAGEPLVIEVRIDPSDIDVIRIGLPVQVRFTALNQRNVSPIMGTLTAYSADRLVEPRTAQSYYLGRVEIQENQWNKFSGVTIMPGMQTEVLILTGENTVLEYLLKPITSSFNRAFRDS